MEVGLEGCLDMLMLCACCLVRCTLNRHIHTHIHTHTHTHTHTHPLDYQILTESRDNLVDVNLRLQTIFR